MLKEVEAYLTKLADLRNQAKTLLEGLPPEALDWRPIREKETWRPIPWRSLPSTWPDRRPSG